MNEDATVSERDAVIRERNAIDAAAVEVMRMLREAVPVWDGGGPLSRDINLSTARVLARRFVESMDFRDLANRVRPIPPRIVPRVVRLGWSECRIVDGKLQTRGIGCEEWHVNITTIEQIRDLASLLENPTEEVVNDV